MKTAKKVAKILLWTLAIAAYFNIGWALGTYQHNKIQHTTEAQRTTIMQHVLAGPNGFLTYEGADLLRENQVLMSFIWPISLLIAAISWVVFGIYKLLWLIFAGGIAKLLGAG